MNVQLYIENQLCDFDKGTYFTLQKEFEDEAQLIVKEIEYSYTISIPTSTRNKRILGFIDDFDVPNKFGRVYDAELYVGEILILKGKLKLSEIDGEYFKGNLYNPTTATVSDILGDRMLNEIMPHMKPMNSMTDMKECNNYVMGMNTTEIPLEQYRDRHICYPYVLYSLPYNDGMKALEKNLNFYTQDLEYKTHTMGNDNVFPAFNVCSVLKDMFETEGYNVQGNIFDDDKFKDLYQTFQMSYQDYLDKKFMPYYLNFNCKYNNLNIRGNNATIPSTLQVATLWTESSFKTGEILCGDGDSDFSAEFDGTYKAGVDCPLVADNSATTVTIRANEQNIMAKGEEYGGYTIVVPKSGWYKIHCDGSMKYPLERSRSGEWNVYGGENTEMVGGMFDECDNTSLEQQPFEFQIKKGYPAENPQLYSFNSSIPCMPTHYSQFNTVQTGAEDDDCWSGVKCQKSESQTLYGKNGKQTLIKNYSDKPTNDFLCGARFGGALFSIAYNCEYRGDLQSNNKLALMGECLALPRADKPLTFKTVNNDKYFRLSEWFECDAYEYSNKTAQILLKYDASPLNSSFSNFDGYNKVNLTTGQWDTTTNYGALSYPSDDTNTKYTVNSAYTTSNNSGNWNMNTVVWLEKDENISFELIMPYHYGGIYYCCHSEWINRSEWVNHTMVDFNFEMGYINSDKKWIPTSSSPIPTFDELSRHKETNVNSMLPNIKCNDYLNNFLQTFNLQLTMPTKNTFSIDYAAMNNVMGNVISIENLANIKDASFKALDLPSTRQLSWKIDKSETGYYDGNQSPYKTEDLPWYNSGYTGSITVTNETNTSGSIDKKESSWSYNWYKDIRFLNGLGLSESEAAVPVLADKEKYDIFTSSFLSVQGDTPNTSKTMRFFFLGKNADTSMYKYIEFKYDESNSGDLTCRLVIPSNYIETLQSDNSMRHYMLDYNNSATNTNKGQRKTITDIFFNLQVQSGYEIEVPIKLTNELYKKINGGTLIKFNDGLYKVKSIDGHDVMENNDATLTLLTLK